jgi:trehalose 6-phosphate synthase
VQVGGDGLRWVHDYHLMLVPSLLRRAGAGGPIGFFLHVPFPPPEIYARLPWREQVLDGLLGADVVSFHHRGVPRQLRAHVRAPPRGRPRPGADDRAGAPAGTDRRAPDLDRRPHARGGCPLGAVPSRGEIREYRELRGNVEELVGRINGRFTEPGGDVPVYYLYRRVPHERLLAYYRLADVCLVTPLADGMNLVAKELTSLQALR